MHNPSRHLETVKTLLWGVMGVWAVVTVARFLHGIGATSGLNDTAPWGFWIAFDVMAGVALADGGFVVAAIVYIFGLQRYHSFARPAILTALLGYVAVAVGLLYDLGIPWHIWHPMVMPQHHSVLFEVAMCVMLYLTVLSLEFTPAILEHPLFHRPFFQRILAVVKKITIPLVIAGIVLSTLHQSSLGSLFLIQPFRVHPLWYSPILYILFFVSAVGLGLMMVTLESLLSSWLFGHKVDSHALAGLGRLASLVLAFYVLLRVWDLWRRGVIPDALDGSWQSGLFLFELAFSAVIPAALLSIRRVRHSRAGLATCSTMVVLGIIWHRFNVCIIAFARPEDMGYWPTWIELAVSVGIVSGAALVFIFFNENLRIVEHHQPGSNDAPADPAYPQPPKRSYSSAFRRHSLAFVVAAGLACGLLPQDAVFGPAPRPTPVRLARNVEALATDAPPPWLRTFHISSLSATVPAAEHPRPVSLTLIDGNRDWRLVPFTHDDHAAALGGGGSCRLCHHQNMPFDQNTACYQCHRDMYETTDTFDHVLHVERLGGNAACAVCHARDPAGKRRRTALACWECHGDMVVKGSTIEPSPRGLEGFAPGYMQAMHGLCINCHERLAREQPEVYSAEFARCDVCHREFKDRDHRRMAPYVPMPPGHLHEELWPRNPAGASRGAQPSSQPTESAKERG
jgi:Ni/Fe-hydrogenase subunit HybB-like protein